MCSILFKKIFLDSPSESPQIHNFTLGNAFCVMLFVSCFLCHAFCLSLSLSLTCHNSTRMLITNYDRSWQVTGHESWQVSLSPKVPLLLGIYGRFRPCFCLYYGTLNEWNWVKSTELWLHIIIAEGINILWLINHFIFLTIRATIIYLFWL